MTDTQAGSESASTALQVTGYEGDVQANLSKRLPLQNRLKPGTTVRFSPHIQETDPPELTFRLRYDDDVTGERSDERALKYLESNEQHVLVWPRDLARAAGLAEHAERTDAQVRVTAPTADRGYFDVAFDPPVTLPVVDPQDHPQLSPVVRELTPLSDAAKDTPMDVEKYRLWLPTAYEEVYGFTPGLTVGIRLCVAEGELALEISPGADAPLARTLLHETRETESSTGRITETDQYGLYVPKVLVHCLNLHTSSVRLTPDTDSFLLS